SDNQAIGGAGGSDGNGGLGRGGGLFVTGDTTVVEIEHGRITGNRAIGGAAGAGGRDGEGVGGGVYILAGTVCVRRTRIENNFASTRHHHVLGDINLC